MAAAAAALLGTVWVFGNYAPRRACARTSLVAGHFQPFDNHSRFDGCACSVNHLHAIQSMRSKRLSLVSAGSCCSYRSRMRRSLMADKLWQLARAVWCVWCALCINPYAFLLAVHRPWKGLLEEPKYLQLLSGGSYRWLKGTSSEIILGWFKVRRIFPAACGGQSHSHQSTALS